MAGEKSREKGRKMRKARPRARVSRKDVELDQLLTPERLTKVFVSMVARRMRGDDEEDEGVTRDEELPEEAAFDLDKFVDWLVALIGDIALCNAALNWVGDLLKLISAWKLAPEGRAKELLLDELKNHLGKIKDIVKSNKKTDKDVDDPYHDGDFDTRTCITFSPCGQKDYKICLWQDTGALLGEAMITIRFPDGREEVIFWYD